ncbi:MAG: IS30 family transposase [Burkholderiales bacterium]
MTYCQLTKGERYTISLLRIARYSVTDISKVLGRHRSTIYREVTRNSTTRDGGERLTYCPSKAQKRRNGKLRQSRRGRQHAEWQYQRVEHLLRQQWSPEQVSSHLKKEGEFVMSFQTIYRHVRRDWKAHGTLFQELRHRYKRRKRHYGLERRGRLQGKRMIDERPAHIEARCEVGHWENDTVMGKAGEKECIVTMVERASGTLLIGKLRNRTVEATNQRMISLIKNAGLPFLTMTSDNGTEFNGYAQIEAATGVTVYFARPHHPWERGSNENTNGLIRQYLPKGQSMASLTQKQCTAIAHKLNTRPRKRYGYDTPLQRLLKCS